MARARQLRHTKPRANSKRAAAPKLDSSLCNRANGFLLGSFMVLVRYGFARDTFQLHRRRINEFLVEAGIHVALPASQREYGSRADSLLQEVILACRSQSTELGDFVLLGGIAMIDAAVRLSDEPVTEDLRSTATEVLGRHKLDGKALYDRFLAYVQSSDLDAKERGISDVRIDTFLTPAMHLLTATIEPLDDSSPTCFVAMPFKPPYSGYFSTFYRPLASQLDCGAFRMWGGLSGEAYVELMLAIMRRCRIVIADLSDVNPNVLYEFGVARGLEKRVIPLCQRRYVSRLPSNISSDTMLQLYSHREEEWPTGTALRCAAQVSLIDFSRELAERRLAEAHWEEGDRLPRLPSEDDEAKDGP